MPWPALTLVAALACGGGERRPAADSVRASDAVVVPPRAETREGARPHATRVLGAADGSCPLVDPWQPCSVEDRLVRAGLAPQRADSAPAPVAGSVATGRYWLGDVELQVFLFSDAAARARVERELGSALGEPPLLEAAQGAPRSTLASSNLVGVLYGARPRQVERVTLALSGGLPAR